MRIAFISDIHGNAIALEAVLENINKKQVDKVLVLGDIAYRGPEPKRSIELIQKLYTTVIKGNADEWIVRGVQEGEVPNKVLELMNKERNWTVSQLAQTDIDYLANLPTELAFEEEGISFHAFHATPNSLFDVVLPNTADDKIEETMMTDKTADIYLYGHIHKPYIRYINGKTIINLGSVGLPFDGQAKASYAIVDINDGSVSTSIERVAYDFEKTIAKYKEVNYPNTDMMESIIRKGSL
ncbi:YfcE family phosphodiesterase [Aquibacillus halophilus]|uniref:Phosphoesterase n=1 Tax=Aquibacillus halophilus TaxID=930132 RepID=A0A6A8DDY2_9BACI|nr:metallophosphoesterase family protein [Aquibacillus halophilus]MRH42726.1 YfcE family phosphodiesterase [Aquibacillus halophilus]